MENSTAYASRSAIRLAIFEGIACHDELSTSINQIIKSFIRGMMTRYEAFKQINEAIMDWAAKDEYLGDLDWLDYDIWRKIEEIAFEIVSSRCKR